jgi:hypothetical protein
MDQPGLVPITNENVVEITPRTWNAIAQSANRNRLGQRPGQPPASLDYPPVYVQNKTGSAINSPYRAFSLGEPIWTIGPNQLAQCCFRLEAYDAAKPIAVIQQPLVVDEVGLAVVVGPTLVSVTGAGSTSDRQGSPNSSGEIVPGSGNKVSFAGSRPTGGGQVLALLGASGGSGVRMFKTPAGGVPAASGATPGSATCTEYPNGLGGSAGATATIYNHRTNVIPGDVFILVDFFGPDLYCVEPNCPAAISLPP